MRFGKGTLNILALALMVSVTLLLLPACSPEQEEIGQPQPSERTWIQVSSGATHTCGVTSEGALYCWGNNKDGQLGDDTLNSTTQSVGVATLSFDVVEVAAGGSHTCARLKSGELYCWGSNTFGQLGIGTPESHRFPALVSDLPSGVARVTAGFAHTCVILDSGPVYCWGFNLFGTLGDGSTEGRRSPVAIPRLSHGAIEIAAGVGHSCALIESGAVYCWGNNANGELGDGTGIQRLSPTAVSGLSTGVVQVAARDARSCATRVSGEVLCWGTDSRTNSQSRIPARISGLPNKAKIVSVSDSHACATMDTGGLHCWGTNEKGQLGDGTKLDRHSPAAVSSLPSTVAEISVGSHHSCALLTTGELYCWGGNSFGQLGDGTLEDRVVAARVLSPTTR